VYTIIPGKERTVLTASGDMAGEPDASVKRKLVVI
jgi:hypothetical protein